MPERNVICDLDGVVWLEGEELPGAADAVRRLRAARYRVGFVTNNSGRTPDAYVGLLAKIGIDSERGAIVTSALAAAALLARDLPAGSRVHACAGEGVVDALTECGFEVVEEGPCDAVVVGRDPFFDYDRLTRAADAVRAGARFVATNTDPTFPVPGRVLPGAGPLVAAVASAAGREPEVAGKPCEATVALVRERFGPQGVMIGDRPSTDGALATALGWPFALVASSVSAAAGEPPDGAALRAGSLAGIVDQILNGDCR